MFCILSGALNNTIAKELKFEYLSLVHGIYGGVCLQEDLGRLHPALSGRTVQRGPQAHIPVQITSNSSEMI